jgi:hypothetical protein
MYIEAFIAVTIALTFGAGVCPGQSNGYFIFKAGGGVSFPQEQPGVYNRDAGYDLNIGAGGLFSRYFGARLDIDYDMFRDPSARGVTQPDNPRFYMTSISLGVTAGLFKPKTKIKPYTVAGLGFHYMTKLKTDSLVLMPSEVCFSVFAGAGVFFTFTREGGLFLETEYQAFLNSDHLKANIPLRFGIVYCPGR